MQFFILVLLFCFVIFLFSLYTFSHDDFVLLRRNVSTDDIFNYAFEISIISLLFSRIFYVIFHPKPIFLNPLGFVLFPYFPGLSMLGGVVGALIFFLFLLRKNKFPIGRVFDFFTMSFLCTIPFGLLGYMLLAKDYSLPTIGEFILYSVFLVTLIFVIMPRFMKNGKQDGIIGIAFMIFFSIVSGVHLFLDHSVQSLKILNFVILLLILVASVVLLLRQMINLKPIFKK